MKSILYLAFFLFTSIGVYAQEVTQQSLVESTKETATKISQELNLDDNKTIYLHRAILSTEQTKLRAKEQLGENPEQLEAMVQKINDQFGKMLTAKFTETEITSIKKLIKK